MTKHHLVDVWRGKMEFSDVFEVVEKYINSYEPNVILVEDTALIKVIARSIRLHGQIVGADSVTLASLAKQEKVTSS